MSYTYRQLFTKHLPEPYRSQALINTTARGLDLDRPLDGRTSLWDALLSAFIWEDTPEGFAYWLAASESRIPNPEPGDRLADLESRIAVLESRIAVLEGLVIEPAAPAVDPGPGYRLLEEGETILEGDEEADEEEGGGWSGVVFPGDAYKPHNWFPVRRCEPGEGYRLVGVDELIETGDEWLDHEGWNPTKFKTGSGVAKSINTPLRRKIPGPPKPPTYRLLNPGEIIREGDEVWIACQESWETFWPGVIGDLKADYPAPPARRQIKSYEDA